MATATPAADKRRTAPLWVRVGGALVLLGVGLFLAMQSASLAASRQNPALSLMLGLYPSRAAERVAVTQVIADEAGIRDVSAAQELARQAFTISPARTEAAAILALAADDARQAEGLAATRALSRRGRFLNFASLQLSAGQEDIEQGLRATDRLLTLYPSLRRRLTPVLGTFLVRQDALPIYRQMLQRRPVWAEGFFQLWNLEPEAQRNLGRLRIELGPDGGVSDRTDQRLVARLASAGHLADAAELYTLISPGGEALSRDMAVDWAADLPPFDWELQNRRDFHARTTTGRPGLRVRIDAGKGGPIAERLIPVPEGARTLSVTHDLTHAADRPLQITATCPGNDEGSQAELVGEGTTNLVLPAPACDIVQVRLQGRARTGSQPIRGEITGMQFDLN